MGPVPSDDLFAPAADGAAEGVDFGWAVPVEEVAGDVIDPLAGDDRIGVGVDRADDFLGPPCLRDLALGVAGAEETAELGVAVFVDAFVGLGERRSDACRIPASQPWSSCRPLKSR